MSLYLSGLLFGAGMVTAAGAAALLYQGTLIGMEAAVNRGRQFRSWHRDRAQTREFMNRPNAAMPGWQRKHQDKVRAEHGLAPLRTPGGE